MLIPTMTFGGFSAFIFACILVATRSTFVVETKFEYYEHDCEDDFFFTSDECDPMFTFCLAKTTFSNSDGVSKKNCPLGYVAESDEIMDEDKLDLSKMKKIGGSPNPWIKKVDIDDVQGTKMKIVVRTRNWNRVDGHEHMATMSKTISVTKIARLRKDAKVLEYTLTSDDNKLKFNVRLYCSDYYYTQRCSVKCKEQKDDKAHYHCDKNTGQKICYIGWKGSGCTEKLPDECDVDKQNCMNGGTCKTRYLRSTCECHPHYFGPLCEEKHNLCESSPCLNNGTCVWFDSNATVNNYTCLCADGWRGENCVEKVDPCEATPCQNNGICESNDLLTNFTCNCTFPYNGTLCEDTEIPMTEAPQTKATDTDKSGGGNAGGTISQKQSSKDDKSNYELLLILLIIPVIALFCILCCCWYRRRKKKDARPTFVESPQPSTVCVPGQGLSFENHLYRNPRKPDGKRMQPSTPSEDPNFNPTKLFFLPNPELEGATNKGYAPMENQIYLTPSTEVRSEACTDGVDNLNTTCKELAPPKVSQNNYTSIQCLNEPHLQKQSSVDSQGYQDLNELQLIIRGHEDTSFGQSLSASAPPLEEETEIQPDQEDYIYSEVRRNSALSDRASDPYENGHGNVPMRNPLKRGENVYSEAERSTVVNSLAVEPPESDNDSDDPEIYPVLQRDDTVKHMMPKPSVKYDHLETPNTSRRASPVPGPYAVTDPFHTEDSEDEGTSKTGLPDFSKPKLGKFQRSEESYDKPRNSDVPSDSANNDDSAYHLKPVPSQHTPRLSGNFQGSSFDDIMQLPPALPPPLTESDYYLGGPMPVDYLESTDQHLRESRDFDEEPALYPNNGDKSFNDYVKVNKNDYDDIEFEEAKENMANKEGDLNGIGEQGSIKGTQPAIAPLYMENLGFSAI